MGMTGRSLGGDARFGFNGQQRTDEVYGKGNQTTALFWEYDARTARRWNTDPVVKESESSYLAFGGNPITNIDPDGADSINVTRNMTTFTNSEGQMKPLGQTENMDVVKAGGSDVFSFTLKHQVYGKDGSLDRVETTKQVFAINSNEQNSLYGDAYNIYLDGMLTSKRPMTAKETVGQWMNQNADFESYMLARTPESSYWQTGIKANLAYGGSGLGQAVTWGALGNLGTASRSVNAFGSRGGYGLFGQNGLKIGNYRLDLMYANPSAGEGAGTIFSLKQMKQGGALWRWDYGKLHTTGEMGLHSTIRFYWNGVKFGNTAQRTWFPSTLRAPFFKQL